MDLMMAGSGFDNGWMKEGEPHRDRDGDGDREGVL